MPLDRLLAGLILATSLACASTPRPSTRSAAASPDAARTQGTGDLRVMTFNIQSAVRGMDGVVETIRSASPDIVALQEVDVGSTRARGQNQPAVMAERTGLPYHAHFRTTDLFGGAYGVALLSRFPLLSVKQYPLPVTPGDEPRTVAHVLMNIHGQEVSIYVTHLTKRPFNESIRTRQSVAILKLLEQDPRPKLLMGDLNETAQAPAVRLFTRQLMDVFALRGQGPADTYPLPVLADLRIDYVLASDRFMPRHSRVLRVNTSDHYPVVADLTLLEPLVAPAAEVVERATDASPGSSQ